MSTLYTKHKIFVASAILNDEKHTINAETMAEIFAVYSKLPKVKGENPICQQMDVPPEVFDAFIHGLQSMSISCTQLMAKLQFKDSEQTRILNLNYEEFITLTQDFRRHIKSRMDEAISQVNQITELYTFVASLDDSIVKPLKKE